MRYIKVFTILIGLLFFSCTENPVEKPNNLLSEEVMLDILYDTALLQAAEGYVPQKLTEGNIIVNTFIFNKYKIDSATYYQNHKYYAANLSKYKKMYRKVVARLENSQIKLDSLLKANGPTKVEGKRIKFETEFNPEVLDQ
jgi:hypothetical protein